MKTSVLKRKRNKKRGRKKSASKSIGQRNLTFVRIIIKRAGLSKCFPARDMEAMVRERKRSRPERCRTEREVLRERLFAESRDPLPHRFGDPLVFLPSLVGEEDRLSCGIEMIHAALRRAAEEFVAEAVLLRKVELGVFRAREFLAEMMDADVRIEVGGGRSEVPCQIEAREVAEEDLLQEALRCAARHQVEEGIMPGGMQAALAQIAGEVRMSSAV